MRKGAMAVRMAQRLTHACGCACLQTPARTVSLARRSPLGMPLHAVPPPTTERSLHLQQLYAQHRPLLEHELLPARPRRLIQRDLLLTEFEEEPQQGNWRRCSRGVDAATFSAMLDRLAQLQVTPRAKRMRRQARRATPPTSPVVYAESKRIERMERDADDREEAIANALERGEDVTRAERLGAEADLVVLGEPDGSQKEWGRGVATHLGVHTEPYVPPGTRVPRTAYIAPVNEQGMDQDAHLWLSHALVQNRVQAAREWDETLWRLGDTVQMDSVRRKRRKKMNKHKYKKLRKAQRAERQRLKK